MTPIVSININWISVSVKFVSIIICFFFFFIIHMLYYTVTLKIWTRVKEIEHTAVTYLGDSDKRLHAFSNGELTEHEFVNACFSAAEQVSEIQANLLSAAIELTTGGSAQPHVGTGGGGSTSDMPWGERKKPIRKR